MNYIKLQINKNEFAATDAKLDYFIFMAIT